MSKSKHGPALFEVFGKAKPPAPGSGVADRASRWPTVSAVEADAAVSRTSQDGGSHGVGVDHALAHHALAEGTADHPPLITLSHGRLLLALGSRGAGVAAFGAVLAACLCFWAGHWAGQASGWADGRKQGRLDVQRTAHDEIAQARNRAPQENLFAGQSPVGRQRTPLGSAVAVKESARRAASSPPGSRTAWVKGNTYVVIQEFPGDARQSALRAQGFLVEHGVDAEVFGSSDRGFKLVSKQGFNRKDATQKVLAERFLQEVKRVGRAYFKAGGRYKLEGYFATLKSDSW